MAKTAEEKSEKLNTIAESKTSTTSASPCTSPLLKPLSPDSKKHVRRESTLQFTTREGPAPWQCETVGLTPDEKAAMDTFDSISELVKTIRESNEELHDDLLDWEEEQLTLGHDDVNLGTAVNRKLDEIRFRIHQVVNYAKALNTINSTHAITAKQLRKELADMQLNLQESEEERVMLLSDNLDLANKLDAALAGASTKAVTTTVPPHGIVDITVPKQYSNQLKASDLKAFEGTTDLDAIYKFLKALTYHIDILENVFNDAQRIEYTLSFLAGGARRWFKTEWKPRTTSYTFDSLMAAFRERWIPSNAHVHLVTKLEEMEMKRGSIDAFNDKFRGILELLQIHDLTRCRESDQYYKIYYSKVKDPAVRQSVLLRSLATPGGLNLDTLMDLVSKLMLALPTRTKVDTPQQQTPAFRPKVDVNKGKKSVTVKVNNLEDKHDAHHAEEATINALVTSTTTTTKPRGGPEMGEPRTCYSCHATDHLLRDCPTRKQFWDRVNKRRQEAVDASAGNA
ncbi:hypothetical protein BJ508DRAFT_320067 [Ascobolus immersus RN42]|uniref:CCHC-type domain-containing protein n=1 Tax=Ascobolus immersus RN42 TaxID=1160509 RepID=A0A3N4J246_ASCIM|nr:hypothetical protein BJ508DRAFT_320067 [Ascobolus immersus RN42]